MEGLSLREQFDYLNAEMDRYKKVWQNREYNRHVIKFFIDLDYIKYDGFPKIRMWPHYTNDLTLPYIIKFICVKEGENHELSPYITVKNAQRRSWR